MLLYDKRWTMAQCKFFDALYHHQITRMCNRSYNAGTDKKWFRENVYYMWQLQEQNVINHLEHHNEAIFHAE